MTKSFGSQIRGGEASCRLRLATQPVLNPNGPLDVAVALNWEDFRRFGAELPVEAATIVIYESNTGVAPDKLPLQGVKPAVVFSVPITEMAAATCRHRQGQEHRDHRAAGGLVWHRPREHAGGHPQEICEERRRAWWKATCGPSRRDWISPRPIR